MKYLIFDFDGVLGDTHDSRILAIQQMEGKSREDIITSSDQYFTKSTHTRDLNLDEDSLKSMREWNDKFGTLLHSIGFELFTNFIKELKKLTDTKMAVVSSGSSICIKPKLENCGLEFSPILTFEDHHSKEEKVEQICKEWEITLQQACFFTDTISDVVELRSILGNNIYGCAWGYQGAEKLATVLDPNFILHNYSDIHRVLKDKI